jgi:hypothetical protein
MVVVIKRNKEVSLILIDVVSDGGWLNDEARWNVRYSLWTIFGREKKDL